MRIAQKESKNTSLKKGIKVRVDFANGEAQFLLENLVIDDVIKEIETIGFKANTDEIHDDNKVEKLFAFCLILTIPLFSHMFLNENHILQNLLFSFFGFACLHCWLLLFWYECLEFIEIESTQYGRFDNDGHYNCILL